LSDDGPLRPITRDDKADQPRGSRSRTVVANVVNVPRSAVSIWDGLPRLGARAFALSLIRVPQSPDPARMALSMSRSTSRLDVARRGRWPAAVVKLDQVAINEPCRAVSVGPHANESGHATP
jgi:hypothetical protein